MEPGALPPIDEASRQAIDFYHEVLAGSPEAAASALQASRALRHITAYGRPICSVLRPAFFSEERYADLMSKTALVVRGIQTIYERARQDDSLRRVLLHPDDAAAWALDAHLEPLDVFGRLDGVVQADGSLLFVENNKAPGGISAVDVFSESFAESLPFQLLQQRFAVRSIATRDQAHRTLVAAAARAGIAEPLVLGWAYVDPQWGKLTWGRQDVIEYLERRGLRVVLAPLAAFECKDGRVYADGTPINLLMGGDPLLPRQLPPDLAAAVRSGALRHVTGFSSQTLLQGKTLFAVLSDDRHRGLFAPEVAAALARHIPWTRVVADGRTELQGRSIDLLPFIADHREELVLKPGFDTGGAGVVLGWQVTAEAWQKTLARALHEPYVVQARVALRRESYPILEDERVVFRDFHCDVDPFYWGPAGVASCLIRLSPGEILNLGYGAGETGLYIVRKKPS